MGLPKDFDSKSGMGMNNLYSRVDLLNANMNFESHAGKGTTITIVIPKL